MYLRSKNVMKSIIITPQGCTDCGDSCSDGCGTACSYSCGNTCDLNCNLFCRIKVGPVDPV